VRERSEQAAPNDAHAEARCARARTGKFALLTHFK